MQCRQHEYNINCLQIAGVYSVIPPALCRFSQPLQQLVLCCQHHYHQSPGAVSPLWVLPHAEVPSVCLHTHPSQQECCSPASSTLPCISPIPFSSHLLSTSLLLPLQLPVSPQMCNSQADSLLLPG